MVGRVIYRGPSHSSSWYLHLKVILLQIVSQMYFSFLPRYTGDYITFIKSCIVMEQSVCKIQLLATSSVAAFCVHLVDQVANEGMIRL